MICSNLKKHASGGGGNLRGRPQTIGWRNSLAHLGIGASAIFFLTFNNVASYAADNDLLKGQILHIACNGDVNDQSNLKHPVENTGVTFGSDRLENRGRACFFDGTDYLKVPKNSAFNLSEFTMTAWVLVEGTYNNDARAIVSNYDKTTRSTAGSYQHYGIGIETPGIANMFYDNGTGIGGAKDNTTTSISLTDARWHHVAMVFQGGVSAKLYVDGELKKLGAGSMPASISPTGDLFIGRGGNSEFGKKWYGSIDEVRILNRALSEDEVNQLSAIIDLPTGETFTTTSDAEKAPFLLNTTEGTVNSVMVTPNSDGSFSLNQVPSPMREGDRTGPSETTTFIINPDGSSTLLDEAQPGMTATVNLFGDLEVTDVSVPDMKLILQRNSDRFAFQSTSDPSVVVRVNHDGTLDIVDEDNPNVSALYNHHDGSYTVVDQDANTVTVIDRNGDAVLRHPDAPGIVATFNVFDDEGNYLITDTTSDECLAMNVESGLRSLRFSFKGIGKSIVGAIGSGVTSAITTVVNNGVQKVVSSVVSGGAKILGGIASKAVSSLGSWWKCLPFIGKFAIVGGVVAVGAAIIGAIFSNNKLKKKIRQLQGQVQQLQGQIQTLTATVQQQAETIRQLEATVAGQAQTIQRLEATIEELKQIIIQQAQVIKQQAEEIAVLRDTVQQQKEIIAKQAETMAAMEKRIAELEAKTRSANDGVEEIPEGVDPAGTKSRHNIRTVADSSPTSPSGCIKLPELPLIALEIVHADVVDSNKVVVGWQTLAEFGNAGFNVYRARKNADGQCTNLTKVNNTLIPSQANGIVKNAYTYEDVTSGPGKAYCYGIESVDTDGKAVLFENRVVKAQGPSLATLGDFTAKPVKDNILLQWETMSEEDTAGFNLWRAKAPADGQCASRQVADYTEVTKLNDQPIVANGTFMRGASYSYKDRQVVAKTTYCYGLEEKNWKGTSTFYWDWLVLATAR